MMITCDLFDVIVTLIDGDTPQIDFLCRTDLPAGAQVLLSCERTYLDGENQSSLWIGHNERLTIAPGEGGAVNVCVGRIDVIASDRKARELFNEINKEFPPGINSPVGDTLTLVFTVGARQRLREFGKNNINLRGHQVHESGGINIVEVAKNLLVPLRPELQPFG